MNNDQIALDIINKWESKPFLYKNGVQEKAALQCLIIEALENSYKQGLLDAETASNQNLGIHK